MESFGSRLVAARKRRGWKQPELATASGVDQGAISRYERDLAEPLLSKAVLLANALKIPIEDLLGQAPAATHTVKMVGEAEFPPDPWPAWVKQLRSAYQKNPDVVASGIRSAWPRPVAEKILTWLRTDPAP